MKVKANTQTRIERIFDKFCFKFNNNIEDSCMYLENDVIDLLWADLRFVHIIKEHKLKYIFEETYFPVS